MSSIPLVLLAYPGLPPLLWNLSFAFPSPFLSALYVGARCPVLNLFSLHPFSAFTTQVHLVTLSIPGPAFSDRV